MSSTWAGVIMVSSISLCVSVTRLTFEHIKNKTKQGFLTTQLNFSLLCEPQTISTTHYQPPLLILLQFYYIVPQV